MIMVLKPRLSNSQLTSGLANHDRALVAVSSLNAMQNPDNARMHPLQKGSLISDIRIVSELHKLEAPDLDVGKDVLPSFRNGPTESLSAVLRCKGIPHDGTSRRYEIVNERRFGNAVLLNRAFFSLFIKRYVVPPAPACRT
jgi:hypothetical protein